MGAKLVENILAALDEQTVAVPGAAAADTVLPRLAESLKTVMAQRETLAGEVEEILGAHPRARVLTSLPGIGVTTAAGILIDVGDASAFKTSGHLKSAFRACEGGASATTWPAGTTSAMENRMVLKENGPTRRGHGPQFAAVQPVTVVVRGDHRVRSERSRRSADYPSRRS
jgi:hypothetical protein